MSGIPLGPARQRSNVRDLGADYVAAQKWERGTLKSLTAGTRLV